RGVRGQRVRLRAPGLDRDDRQQRRDRVPRALHLGRRLVGRRHHHGRAGHRPDHELIYLLGMPPFPGVVADDALALIGSTPLVRPARLSPPGGGVVWGKLEANNPGGSVKDRAALQMVLAAERDKKLRPGSAVVEATSGNTGISLAMIAAVRGYRCVVVMPED